MKQDVRYMRLNGEEIEVRVLTQGEGWLMVRRKGAMPFCVKENETAKTISIEDGFGSAWSSFCAMCNRPSMCVVRPGKVQCNYCG